ncbi:peptidylprolyl isomerase SurA [Thalassotalea sp. PS06]|uniref:peptidylprolyl isomerase SurA n=1 Tax=Thalassotalea sp. PS06 TaxID=2594005 RepID=UPI001165ACB1|nr:peptidylprolyl isomerase SurA [Thalassotalea sp. PS06]QDP02221.1 peptidylprolyl isomerase SurA [Thalassotalea sp. PS06]
MLNKTIIRKAVLASGLMISALSFNAAVKAEEQPLDKVAAIVNSGVVLESEVQALVDQVKQRAQDEGQALPSDNALRTQAMEKLITDSLMMQLGERMGVQISDAQLDETIKNIARENGFNNIVDFRMQILNSGLQWDSYREDVRKELITGEVRRASVRRRVSITTQEIDNLVSMMQQQTNADIEYNLGHILIAFPDDPNQEDLVAAKERADKVVDLLKNGSDFKKIAIASSSAPTALEGGDLGWRGINEMPTLFAELVDGKDSGDIFGPVRTGLGFNIIKILDIRGKQKVEVQEVKSRHILIKPSIILSEEKAEQMLLDMLAKIEAGEADFDTLARENSEGPTATRGGDLGWADPESYDPAFKNALATLDVDEYHKPFRSSFGWHLVQLTGRRTLDATDTNNSNRAYQLIYNRKFGVESVRWMKEIRDEAYIEIMDEGNSD